MNKAKTPTPFKHRFFPFIYSLDDAVFFFTLLMVGIGCALLLNWHEPAPRRASVDVTDIVRELITDVARSNLPDDEKNAQNDALAKSLKSLLQELADSQQTVSQSAPTVIDGAAVITEPSGRIPEAIRQSIKK